MDKKAPEQRASAEQQRSAGAAAATTGQPETLAFPGPISASIGLASLIPFPARLQEVIMEAVEGLIPKQATDIWYQDDRTGMVFVLRQGMQWQLNETASAVWTRLGRPVRDVLGELSTAYPGTEHREMRFLVVEFLLHAASQGLIDLYPEGSSAT